MLNKDIEYKIICGSSVECQKWLNQWKHEFELNIISMSTSFVDTINTNVITILLTRKGIIHENRGNS